MVVWFVELVGKSSCPQNCRKKFSWELYVLLKESVGSSKAPREDVENILTFLNLLTIILYLILFNVFEVWGDDGVYAVISLWSGRRCSTLSPELLKYFLQRGISGLYGDQPWRGWVFAEHSRKGEPAAIPCIEDYANIELTLAFLTHSQQQII